MALASGGICGISQMKYGCGSGILQSQEKKIAPIDPYINYISYINTDKCILLYRIPHFSYKFAKFRKYKYGTMILNRNILLLCIILLITASFCYKIKFKKP